MTFTREHLVGRPERVRRVFELAGVTFEKRPRGTEWRVLCPFHDDHDPSMDVSLEKAAYVCRACGASGDSVTFYKLAMHLPNEAEAIADLRQKLGISPNGAGSPVPAPTPTRRWEIRDVAGNVIAVHCRRDPPSRDKELWWERDGSKGLRGLRTTDLPLYGSEYLDQERPDVPVIITEGEKAADALTEQGYLALGTVTGASGIPSPKSLEVLSGRHVVLWPDFDKAGGAHMDRLGAALQGVASTILIFRWGLVEKDDAVDFFARGGTPDQLDRLLESAEEFTPPSAPGSGAQAEQGTAVIPDADHQEENASPCLAVVSAREILATDYSAPRWIVEGLVLEGLLILAGRPKIGKSWLALALALAAVFGGKFLGRFAAVRSGVLYLALEDSPRRIKKRLLALNVTSCPGGLGFLFTLPRLDAGGAEALDAWLAEHPDVHLVVIDTLNRVRSPRPKNLDPYQHDAEEIGKLQAVATRRGVSLVILHHDRKADAEDWLDRISGTLGVAGTADSIMLLERDRGSANGRLRVTGRDLEDEPDLSLEFVRGLWHVIGPGDLLDLSPERRKIIDALPEAGDGLSPTQIKLKAHLPSVDTVKHALPALEAAGLVLRARHGKYLRKNTHTLYTDGPPQ